MKIVELTSTRLKLQGKGRLNGLSGVLFGTPFFLAGLAVIFYFGKLIDLKCDRRAANQIACELASANLLGKNITVIPSGQIISAKVQESGSSDGDTYRVVLLTKSGSIPMTEFFSGGTGVNHQKHADEINDFIGAPGIGSLQISQDHRWFAYPFGGLFALVGGGIILGSLICKFQVSCLFDKSSGKMYVKTQSMFQSEVKEWMLYDIKESNVTAETNSDGDTTYKTKLILKYGEEIPLEVSDPGSNHYKVSESINRFLGGSPRS